MTGLPSGEPYVVSRYVVSRPGAVFCCLLLQITAKLSRQLQHTANTHKIQAKILDTTSQTSHNAP